MKLKLDDKGNVVLQDGKPVYIMDDNTEVAFDAVGSTQSIARLNQEARNWRKQNEELTGKLQAFDGLDPIAARKALDTVKNFNDGDLIKAGKLEELKGELNKAWQTKIDEITKDRDAARNELHAEKIGGAFKSSQFLPKTSFPAPEVAQAYFGKHFQLEGGKIVAVDAAGNKLHSLSNPGELASFDEALSILVNSHPNKAAFLKSDFKGGGGNPPGGGTPPNGGGAGKVISRAQYEAMEPLARSAHFAGGGTVVDTPQV